MKYHELKRSAEIKVRRAGLHEDIFLRDEGDDRVNPGFMLFPLLTLQALTLLSILL